EEVGGCEVGDRPRRLPELRQPVDLVSIGREGRVRPDEADREEVAPARGHLRAGRGGRQEQRDGEAAGHVDEQRAVRPARAEAAGKRGSHQETRYGPRGPPPPHEQKGPAPAHPPPPPTRRPPARTAAGPRPP